MGGAILAARALSTYFQARGTLFPQHRWETSSWASSGDGRGTTCAASAEETWTVQTAGSQPVLWATFVYSATSSHGEPMRLPVTSDITWHAYVPQPLSRSGRRPWCVYRRGTIRTRTGPGDDLGGIGRQRFRKEIWKPAVTTTSERVKKDKGLKNEKKKINTTILHIVVGQCICKATSL
ncbi:hypothetical protein B296_00006865 [Ensete ventricosum]|uniref:Uncharacterized protein n=1 Tax=Ensete ventricosum TaxID=4639 RepID=A0A427ANP1_ENSVE|nr:hypothetical protein B296_00006865 [Ensete ventricosum]